MMNKKLSELLDFVDIIQEGKKGIGIIFLKKTHMLLIQGIY